MGSLGSDRFICQARICRARIENPLMRMVKVVPSASPGDHVSFHLHRWAVKGCSQAVAERHLIFQACSRDCMCPVVLTRGSDQMAVSTKFDMRNDENVIRNYGRMLIELSGAIPDGIICFFVSYSYMDQIVSKWNDMGILQVLIHANVEPPQISCCTGTCSGGSLCP